MQTVTLGPLAWSLASVLLMAGVVTAFAINGWWRRRGRPSSERALWCLLLLSAIVARAVFVIHWWPDYAAAPLGMLDLRDGGMSWPAGLAALVCGGAGWMWHQPSSRGALGWSLLGGLLVGGLGLLIAARLDASTHRALPALVLHDLEGRAVALHQFDGKPLVVNLWATWCPPCRREMPVLVNAQRRHADVRFMFVDAGESAGAVRRFLKAAGLQPENVLLDDTQQLAQAFDVRVFPTTLFFDAQGILRSTHVGALSPATLAAELRHITPESPLAPAHLGVLQ